MLGGAFGLTSNSGCVESMLWTPASWSAFNTDGGYAGNGNYNDVIFGQLVIPGVPPFDVPGAGPELGSSIGFYTITTRVGSAGVIDFDLIASSPFSLEVIDIGTGEISDSSQGNLSLNGTTITCLPSPGTFPVFGAFGLIAARRLRRSA